MPGRMGMNLDLGSGVELLRRALASVLAGIGLNLWKRLISGSFELLTSLRPDHCMMLSMAWTLVGGVGLPLLVGDACVLEVPCPLVVVSRFGLR